MIFAFGAVGFGPSAALAQTAKPSEITGTLGNGPNFRGQATNALYLDQAPPPPSGKLSMLGKAPVGACPGKPDNATWLELDRSINARDLRTCVRGISYSMRGPAIAGSRGCTVPGTAGQLVLSEGGTAWDAPDGVDVGCLRGAGGGAPTLYSLHPIARAPASGDPPPVPPLPGPVPPPICQRKCHLNVGAKCDYFVTVCPGPGPGPNPGPNGGGNPYVKGSDHGENGGQSGKDGKGGAGSGGGTSSVGGTTGNTAGTSGGGSTVSGTGSTSSGNGPSGP